MDTLSRRIKFLSAEVCVKQCYSKSDAKFHNDVYKWELHITVPGPDYRYNPGRRRLDPYEVFRTISYLELAYQEMCSLKHNDFIGTYKKIFGNPLDTTVELISENGKTEVRIPISSKTFRFYEKFCSEETLLGAIEELKNVDRIGKELIEELKKLDPQEYEKLKKQYLGGFSAEGCFIATAVYESSYSLEVNILKNFRDKVLNDFFIGRIFIRYYYAISPKIAIFILKHKRIKLIVKCLLDVLTKLLKRFSDHM